MAIEAKERRIGAHVYRITQLPAKRGRTLLVRFARLLGPGAGAFVGGLGRGKGGFDAALGMGIAEALLDVFTRLNDEDVTVLCDAFAEYTVVVQSREIERRLSDIFDDHFAGAYDEMLLWLRACCEVNFASFFTGSSAGGALQRLTQALSRWASLVPTSSTGTSTASQAAADMPTS